MGDNGRVAQTIILTLFVQELEENKSERSQKYRELRKREETMDHFLSTFEDSKQEEKSRLEVLENNNVALLEKLSRHLAHLKQLPRYPSHTHYCLHFNFHIMYCFLRSVIISSTRKSV